MWNVSVISNKNDNEQPNGKIVKSLTQFYNAKRYVNLTLGFKGSGKREGLSVIWRESTRTAIITK